MRAGVSLTLEKVNEANTASAHRWGVAYNNERLGTIESCEVRGKRGAVYGRTYVSYNHEGELVGATTHLEGAVVNLLLAKDRA